MVYQAIVFAGGNGNRMTNLTEHISKALLPVANIPLFWYSLNLLSHVILVTNRYNYAAIDKLLKTDLLAALPNELEINIVKIDQTDVNDKDDDDDVDEWGTADVLRHIDPYIKKDVIY